jgi:hypothetical protein
LTKDKKTRNALKAKLRRLCERKKNSKLQVPEWLHEQWKAGNHMSMALNLQKVNFNKDYTPPHFQTKHHLIKVVATPGPSSFQFQSCQEEFIKRCEMTTTELEREKNVINCGWYSKEGMKSQLKWNPILG